MSNIRRRNKSRAALHFYERHDDNAHNNDKDDTNDYKALRQRSVFIHILRKVLSTSLKIVSLIRLAIELMLRHLVKTFGGNVDLTHYCVACNRRFSILGGTWRRNCANCTNDFCDNCLNKRHEIFDGKVGSAGVKKPVCAYCFFTLCARHCQNTKCCADLPIKELKSFLRRKGIPSNTALEKSDLLELINDWSLELDKKAAWHQQQQEEDLEAANTNKDNNSDISRDCYRQTSYSVGAAHLTINAMDEVSTTAMIHNNSTHYSNLTVQEIRHLLKKRGVNARGCIEKTDLITLLVQSDGIDSGT